MCNHQWILDGLKQPGKNKDGLAKAMRWSNSIVTSLFDSKKPRKLKWEEVPKIAEYLDVIPPPVAGYVPIVGQAGDSPDGAVRFAAQNVGESPMPLGGRKDTVAIEIIGGMIRAVAPEGSLLFYDSARAPTDEMIGELCVVWLEDGRALLKIIHKGRGPGLYDLESGAIPIMHDVPVRQAALVTTIIPRPQAKKIIRREAREIKQSKRKSRE